MKAHIFAGYPYRIELHSYSNPYSTAQLRDTLHNFDLPENDFVNLCLDLAHVA